MNIDVEIKSFSELSIPELYELMVLRNRVFVVGQNITAEAEVDGRDPECHHVIMRSGGEIVGTARLFMDKEPVKVGRVCVDTSLQRTGFGSQMMRAIQEFLGPRSAALNAQAHLEQWYARLGWRRRGPVFDEAEIPHVRMEWSGA